MSSEKVVDEILRNPQLISAIADRVYEKLKDEIVIKRLEENTRSIQILQEAVKSLQEEVKKQGEAIVSLQQEVKRHGEAITSLQQEVKKQGEAIVSLQEAVKSLQEEVKRHGEAITSLQEAVKSLQEEVKKQGEAIVSLQQEVKRHGEAITSLQEEVKRHGEAITSLQQEVKKQGEAIVSLQKEIERHSRIILRLVRSQKKFSVELGSFTSRAGKGFERTMLKLYRKALELHGVDPKRVEHGTIVDTVGVIEKGRSFEVDFYETNDYIYVFEIKNFSDKGVIDQVFIRKKLFSALYNKPLKVFVVTNYIEKEVKEKLEKEGVEIIASYVVD
ncbi:hypothetical protein GFS03_03865 [Sulfolobus sp. E5-1-F]|uniref:hypothetical protein n=1 Tax=Saccharolobus sp. E5-1-F TaxID=2663019 RepID=UPI001295180A|nr:hypothetical protein [Sulfolobus sp. E5-1-F]QGA53782.1 hypothetical protein GFS03_03865 [Sulfolobus sp. E5-1-F]